MRIILTLFLLSLLQACTSIPLSSLIKLSTFGAEEFSQIDPKQIRARLTINDPAKLQLHDVRLVFKFEYQFDEKQAYQFILIPISQRDIPAQSHWYGGSPIRHQYDFKIAEKSIAEFNAYQQQLLQRGKPKNFHWTVHYYLDKDLPSGYAIDLDLAIKFSNESDYLMILKGASVDIE